jgi:hypothetical protein
MIPIEQHIDALQRYEQNLKSLYYEIKAKEEAGVDSEELGRLALLYFKASKVWEKLDEFIEYEVETAFNDNGEC